MSVIWGGSVVVPQSAEEVWTFLISDTNDVNWRSPWVVSVRPLDGGPIAAGKRYETAYRFFGRPNTVVTELTEATPGRRLAWRQVSSSSTFLSKNDGWYELEPAPGGTRVTIQGDIDSHPLLRPFVGLFAAYLQRTASPQQRARLAAALDAAGSGG